MALKIQLTWDYEIFFGENTGSVEVCIIKPTEKILALAKAYNARFTFFVDVSYLEALRRQYAQFPKLKDDYNRIVKQLQEIIQDGHTCQFHLHTHWEDSYFDGHKWQMNYAHYRIQSYSIPEMERIIKSGVELLTSITGQKPTVFRAGGFCIQPSMPLMSILSEYGIRMDSSVFPGGKSPEGATHFYDFTSCKNSEVYRFSDKVEQSDAKGQYEEHPITSRYYSPLFFGKLYLMGRLFPSLHRMMGDGKALGAKGFRKQQLTQGGFFPLSIDGYYASVLPSAIRSAISNNKLQLIILGHPKAMSQYSFQQLEVILRNFTGNFFAM